MENNFIKRIYHGTILTTLTSLIVMLFSYCQRLFFTRAFSIEEYGLIYSIVAFFNFFHMFYYLGLNNSIVKYISEFKVKGKNKEIKKVLFSSIISQFTVTLPISLLVLIFRKEIALYYFKTSLAISLISFGVIFLLFSPIHLIKEYFRGIQKINLYNLFDIIQAFCLLVGSVFLYYVLPNNLRINVLIISMAAFSVSAAIIYFINLKFDVKLYDYKLSKEMIKFGIPLIFSSVLTTFFGRIDVLLLTFFKNLRDVGYYNVAVPTISAIYGIVSGFNIIIFPLITEDITKKKFKLLRSNLEKVFIYILIITIPLTLFTIINSKYILSILFGKNYMDAYMSMCIYSIMIILVPLNKVCYPLLMSLNKTKEIAVNSSISIIVDTIGNFSLIFAFGLNGVIFSSVFAYFILVLLNFRASNKKIKLKMNKLQIIKLIVFTIISFIGFYIISDKYTFSLIYFIITNIVFGLILLVVIIILRLVTLDEIRNIFFKNMEQSKF